MPLFKPAIGPKGRFECREKRANQNSKAGFSKRVRQSSPSKIQSLWQPTVRTKHSLYHWFGDVLREAILIEII